MARSRVMSNINNFLHCILLMTKNSRRNRRKLTKTVSIFIARHACAKIIVKILTKMSTCSYQSKN